MTIKLTTTNYLTLLQGGSVDIELLQELAAFVPAFARDSNETRIDQNPQRNLQPGTVVQLREVGHNFHLMFKGWTYVGDVTGAGIEMIEGVHFKFPGTVSSKDEVEKKAYWDAQNDKVFSHPKNYDVAQDRMNEAGDGIGGQFSFSNEG